jgi:CubicO group peptidase (beta-lactamase class C family)
MTTLRPGAPEEAGMSPERIDNLRRLCASWIEDGTHLSLVALVARHGVIVLNEAWGRHGPEADAPPLRTDAIFPLASMSKVIAATCAMRLVEDGLLGLNRPVQEYIPEFQGEGKQHVLVHHLLTHTSGLREADFAPRIQEETAPLRRALDERPGSSEEDADFDPIVAKILDVVGGSPLSYPPGQTMSYTPRVGYALLCEVLQRLSGESIARFAQERIFLPLGMDDTTYRINDAERGRLVRRQPHALFDGFTASLGQRVAGYGSATSTALDIAKLGQMYLNLGEYAGTRVLSLPTVREMTRNQVPGIPAEYMGRRVTEASWGYGWGIMGSEKWAGTPSLLSAQTFWHTGGSGVALYVDPRDHLICVYFPVANGGPFDMARREDLFANAAVAAIED